MKKAIITLLIVFLGASLSAQESSKLNSTDSLLLKEIASLKRQLDGFGHTHDMIIK